MRDQDHVRTRYDEWGKRALSLWLKELGDVEIDARVAGESRRGDVLYTERRASQAYRKRLGMLGELAQGRVLFELFRNPPTFLELQGCVLKAVDLQAREARAARRAKRPLSSISELMLCVITPSMSSTYAAHAGATRVAGGSPGLYELSPMWRSVLVVVNELTEDVSTLWLRLLGRGAVQAGAVRELAEMSKREPLRDATFCLLVAWRQSLPPLAQQSEDERELTMNFEQAYERWERKVKAQGHRKGKAQGVAQGVAQGIAQGVAQGVAQGKAEAVLAVLEGRGLTITTAQRKQVLACTNIAKLDTWLRAAGTTPSAKALLSGEAMRRPGQKSP